MHYDYILYKQFTLVTSVTVEITFRENIYSLEDSTHEGEPYISPGTWITVGTSIRQLGRYLIA